MRIRRATTLLPGSPEVYRTKGAPTTGIRAGEEADVPEVVGRRILATWPQEWTEVVEDGIEVDILTESGLTEQESVVALMTLDGIGPTLAQKLVALQIRSVADFLGNPEVVKQVVPAAKVEHILRAHGR